MEAEDSARLRSENLVEARGLPAGLGLLAAQLPQVQLGHNSAPDVVMQLDLLDRQVVTP